MGLLSPEVLALLGGSPQSGLLGRPVNDGAQGLLGDTSRAPGFFGTSADDPRSAAVYALASGLMKGSFADGIQGYSHAITSGRERQQRHAANSLTLGKSALELQQMRDGIARSRQLQEGLAAVDRPGRQSPHGEPSFGAPYEAPDMGGVPMFSMHPRPQQIEPMGNMQGRQPPAFGAYQPQQGSQTNATEAMISRMVKQAQVYAANGDPKTANDILSAAEKWRTEYSTTPQVMRTPDGKLVNVIIGKGGQVQVLPFGVKPDIELRDGGGSVFAVDKNQTTGGQSWDKTLTPGERQSGAIAQAQLGVSRANAGLARERFTAEQNAPQYMETSEGLVALPRKLAPGAQPTAQPVMGSDGEAIGPKLKPIPGPANTAIISNSQGIKQVDAALAALSADPEATGWKGYTPNTVLNRMDPKGVEARAAIADMGSMLIHDRSGAAVTAAEFPRLAPFVPQATDDAETVRKKLMRFRRIYMEENQSLQETYSKGNGYRESGVLKKAAESGAGSEAAKQPTQAMPLPAKPSTATLKVGQQYTLPNGKAATWDGFMFKGAK